MSELPPGWVLTSLSELSEVRLGRQRSPKNHSGSRMRPYLRAANLTWEGLDLSDVKEMNFTEAESTTYELSPGDVLVAEASGSASEVGKAAIWRGEIDHCCFQNTVIRVRSHAPLPEYLRYFLLAEARSGRIGDAAPGVGIHHIGAGRLASWRVPLPPLNEQRRIVAAIEEHLSRLDAADTFVRAAQRRLNALRSASLDSAVGGSWDERPLGELALLVRNGVFVSRPAATPPGTAIFRISAVRSLTLNTDDVRYAPLTASAASKYLVEEGDLLFTRYSGNPDLVGACALVRTLPRPTLHPDKLIRVVVDREQVEPAFVEIACATGKSRDEIRARRKTTAGQVGIAGGQLKSVPIPVPPLEEQRRIVAQVETRLSVIDAMRASIELAQRRSAVLRAAILGRAFRGELVPQDPDDEPADALLASVRADRESAHGVRRSLRSRKAVARQQ